MVQDTFGITLEQVRSFLGYTATGSPPTHPRDAVLQAFLEASIATVQKVLGRNLSFGVYQDTFEHIEDKIYLNEPPVSSIISMSEGSSTLVPPENYQFFPQKGLLAFHSHWWSGYRGRWGWGGGAPLVVQYIGGYTRLPPDLFMIVMNGVQAGDNYQKQQATSGGGTIKRVMVYDVGATDYEVSKGGTNSVMNDLITAQLMANYPSAGGNDIGTWKLRESEFLGRYAGSSPP